MYIYWKHSRAYVNKQWGNEKEWTRDLSSIGSRTGPRKRGAISNFQMHFFNNRFQISLILQFITAIIDTNTILFQIIFFVLSGINLIPGSILIKIHDGLYDLTLSQLVNSYTVFALPKNYKSIYHICRYFDRFSFYALVEEQCLYYAVRIFHKFFDTQTYMPSIV